MKTKYLFALLLVARFVFAQSGGGTSGGGSGSVSFPLSIPNGSGAAPSLFSAASSTSGYFFDSSGNPQFSAEPTSGAGIFNFGQLGTSTGGVEIHLEAAVGATDTTSYVLCNGDNTGGTHYCAHLALFPNSATGERKNSFEIQRNDNGGVMRITPAGIFSFPRTASGTPIIIRQDGGTEGTNETQIYQDTNNLNILGRKTTGGVNINGFFSVFNSTSASGGSVIMQAVNNDSVRVPTIVTNDGGCATTASGCIVFGANNGTGLNVDYYNGTWDRYRFFNQTGSVQWGLEQVQNSDWKIDSVHGTVTLAANNVNAWQIQTAGHLFAASDNSFDIGASGANRPRNLWLAGTSSISGLATFGGGHLFTETAAPANVASSGVLWEDSTSHEYQAATAGSSNAGLLVRSQPGQIHQTGKTAAITTATLCAASAGACNVVGTYHVHWSFWEDGTACGTPATGGVTFLLTWTDPNGTAHSAVSLGMDDASAINAVSQTFHFQSSLATAWGSGDFTIGTNGSIIQYATGYTACGVGTGSYGLDIAVTRVR